jgi:hypothetical protein
MKLGIRDFLSLIVPVLLGLASMGLWLLDIFLGPGWVGLDWIRQEMGSVYVITGLAIVSYLFPFLLHSAYVSWLTLVVCGAGMYTTALMGFFAARSVFFRVYSRLPVNEHIWVVLELFMIAIAVALVLFYLKQYFLFRSDRLHAITLMFAFVSVIPASIISVEWLVNFGNDSSFVDAVKMGYPFLWINIFLGHIAYLMVKKII